MEVVLGDIWIPEFPDGTLFDMSSGPDLFILGDVRASILSDLQSFMHSYATGRLMTSGDKLSTIKDIDPVVEKRNSKIPKGHTEIFKSVDRQDHGQQNEMKDKHRTIYS